MTDLALQKGNELRVRFTVHTLLTLTFHHERSSKP